MSKPVDETLPQRRLYAHYHRLLIDLLEELVEDARVVWLAGEEGHIRRPDGEPNTYRKAQQVKPPWAGCVTIGGRWGEAARAY